ncbi:hypothetical protein M407DRAFT_103007 [Tulasnella calospora MUT 4182]|uniref:Uncharacterized protein n=1 Tax=Tulasnella calospora MUT 4182 TaxID=1051891 RepID=A0A0C3LS65_9AGAM|nr:hypothetical protein M407DRAFT_103007 [Tulasnella calospora MUT 4182]
MQLCPRIHCCRVGSWGSKMRTPPRGEPCQRPQGRLRCALKTLPSCISLLYLLLNTMDSLKRDVGLRGSTLFWSGLRRFCW